MKAEGYRKERMKDEGGRMKEKLSRHGSISFILHPSSFILLEVAHERRDLRLRDVELDLDLIGLGRDVKIIDQCGKGFGLRLARAGMSADSELAEQLQSVDRLRDVVHLICVLRARGEKRLGFCSDGADRPVNLAYGGGQLVCSLVAESEAASRAGRDVTGEAGEGVRGARRQIDEALIDTRDARIESRAHAFQIADDDRARVQLGDGHPVRVLPRG